MVLGCSHRGIENIVRTTLNKFSIPVKRLIGGFHLKDKSEINVIKIAKDFDYLGVKETITGHCTGSKGFAIMKKVFTGITDHLYPGKIIEI